MVVEPIISHLPAATKSTTPPYHLIQKPQTSQPVNNSKNNVINTNNNTTASLDNNVKFTDNSYTNIKHTTNCFNYNGGSEKQLAKGGFIELLCRKSLTRKKVIYSIVTTGVLLILAIFLIVYFTIHGGNKQETSEAAGLRNDRNGNNPPGDNELNPTEQDQTRENFETKQGSSVANKVLKHLVLSATGSGLAMGKTYSYDKKFSDCKEVRVQKVKNDNKERDNNIYDDPKTVTNTEKKNVSNSAENAADTDASDIKKSVIPEKAEIAEKTSEEKTGTELMSRIENMVSEPNLPETYLRKNEVKKS